MGAGLAALVWWQVSPEHPRGLGSMASRGKKFISTPRHSWVPPLALFSGYLQLLPKG